MECQAKRIRPSRSGRWAPAQLHIQWLTPFLFLVPLAVVPLAASAGCTDGDIWRGCRNWCRCYRGDRSLEACRRQCTGRLETLRRRDRAQERQVADCLAAKGKRTCSELALCGAGVLDPPGTTSPKATHPARTPAHATPRP